MKPLYRPLVLIHGLWNGPKVFNKLLKRINRFIDDTDDIYLPELPHYQGRVSLFDLAEDLDQKITNKFGPERNIDLIGFSMGGLISRIWLQEMGGLGRTKNLITIGTPHHGTLMAQVIPQIPFKGISQMKINSNLINCLNSKLMLLESINCISLFTYWDLMVFPFYHAILPIGKYYPLPALTHQQLLSNPKTIELLCEHIFTCSRDLHA